MQAENTGRNLPKVILVLHTPKPRLQNRRLVSRVRQVFVLSGLK